MNSSWSMAHASRRKPSVSHEVRATNYELLTTRLTHELTIVSSLPKQSLIVGFLKVLSGLSLRPWLPASRKRRYLHYLVTPIFKNIP